MTNKLDVFEYVSNLVEEMSYSKSLTEMFFFYHKNNLSLSKL